MSFNESLKRINEFKSFIANAKEQIELLESEDSPGKQFEKLKPIEIDLENSVFSAHDKNVKSFIDSAESIKESGDNLSGYADVEGYNSAANVHNNCLETIGQYSSELSEIIQRKETILTRYRQIQKKIADYLNYIKC